MAIKRESSKQMEQLERRAASDWAEKTEGLTRQPLKAEQKETHQEKSRERNQKQQNWEDPYM